MNFPPTNSSDDVTEFPGLPIERGKILGLFLADSHNSTALPLSELTKLVDDHSESMITLVFSIILSGVVSLVGFGTNVVNILVFYRQGILSDSCTVSLFLLSVSDLGCTASTLFMCCANTVWKAAPSGLHWDPYEVLVFPWGDLKLMFSTISRVITANIALERSICVVFPFKVKLWFNSRRSVVVNTIIFIYGVAIYFPHFFTIEYVHRKEPATNQTRLVMLLIDGRDAIVNFLHYLTSASNIVSVVVIMLRTTVTVSKVKVSRVWRESLAQQAKGETSVETSVNDGDKRENPVEKDGKVLSKSSKTKGGKEETLIKMAIAISAIALLCYLPDGGWFIAHAANEEIHPIKAYGNLARVLYAFSTLADAINASINILVYHKASSRYRHELNKMMRRP